MSDSFKSLMKAKGLLGGKYAPVAVKDGMETEASIVEEDTLGDHNGNDIAEMDKVVKRKFESFETEDLPPPAKKTGGVISSCFGYMKLADDDLENEDNKNMEQADTVDIEKNQKKKKKTAAEYLARTVQSKVENRSTKANVNSMKTKFLTGKKKFAVIQPECGVEQDFMVILENNLQRKDVCYASPTAGKYMIFTKGNIRDQLLGDGIKFDPSMMYMLANDFNY